MRLLIALLVTVPLAHRAAAAQISYSAWSATPLGAGCVGPCNTCTQSFVDLAATVQVSAHSRVPENASCSSGYEVTCTATVGPGPVTLDVNSHLVGQLADNLFGTVSCSASVSFQGSVLLDHGTIALSTGGGLFVDDSKERGCLALGPGTYTLKARLEVSASGTGGPGENFADFATSGPGLEVVFTETTSNQTATYFESNSCTFPNPDILTAGPAVLNTTWTANLTLGIQRSNPGIWVLFFGKSAVSPCGGVPVPTVFPGYNFGSAKGGRMLLCDINTGGLSMTTLHSGALNSVSSVAGAVPYQLCLVDFDWCAQALVLGPIPGAGNMRLSSMIGGVVGF